MRWDQFRDLKRLFLDPAFHICGMYTHFCAADSQEEQDMLFTKEQIRRFEEVVKYLRSEQIPLPSLHMQSSYGLVNYPELVCDYARIGILLYGSLSSGRDEVRVEIPVSPVMEIKARVTSVRELEEGEQAGYGRAFQAEKNKACLYLCRICGRFAKNAVMWKRRSAGAWKTRSACGKNLYGSGAD